MRQGEVVARLRRKGEVTSAHIGTRTRRLAGLLSSACVATAGLCDGAIAEQKTTKLPTIDVISTPPKSSGNGKAPKKPEPSDALSEAQPQPADAAAPAPADTTTAQGIDGYRAKSTSTATKTNTPLSDIPQSVTVVPKELARDQATIDVAKALTYVPGVVVGQGEGHRDAPTIRGVSTTADFFVDGVRDDVQYLRDLYNAERLEVLKGANAMTFGRGGGGGVINRVTKKADGERLYEGRITGGSFDKKRAEVDVGNAVSDTVAVRLNGMYEQSGSFRDFVELERYGINPTLTWKPSDATRIRLAFEHFDDHRTVDRGIPSRDGRPVPVAIERFFGNPDQSYMDFTSNVATATLEHRVNSNVTIKNHSSVGRYDKFYTNVYASSAADATGTVSIGAYDNTTARDSVFNQTDVTVDIAMAPGITHKLLTGIEVGHQSSEQFRFNGVIDGAKTVTLTDSVFRRSFSFSELQNNAINATDLTTVGVYLQDQLEIGRHIDLIGGLRIDRFALDYENEVTGMGFERTDDVVSPRAGIVVKPHDALSLYVSYSKSFLPSSGDQFATLSATTAAAEPEQFINREVGFKWEAMPRLAFAGALFELERSNQLVAVAPGVSQQVGETVTKGAELTLTGSITPDWEIVAGYGYQVAEVVNGGATSTSTTGREVPLVPHHTLSIWNKVRVLPDLAFGVGVVHRTDMYASITNDVILPEMTRVDAALFWTISDTLDAQLNVENLFDEVYYATAHNDNNITPGAPTTYVLTVTRKF